jgi:hypothetical protein
MTTLYDEYGDVITDRHLRWLKRQKLTEAKIDPEPEAAPEVAPAQIDPAPEAAPAQIDPAPEAAPAQIDLDLTDDEDESVIDLTQLTDEE